MGSVVSINIGGDHRGNQNRWNRYWQDVVSSGGLQSRRHTGCATQAKSGKTRDVHREVAGLLDRHGGMSGVAASGTRISTSWSRREADRSQVYQAISERSEERLQR